MKHENKKRYLNDKDRDSILKLMVCGMSTSEIADIMHISTSTVSYLRQAHTACLNKDWSVLQKLSTICRPTVDWAMNVTGTKEVFEATFKVEPVVDEPETVVPEPTAEVPATITREEFAYLKQSLSDICSLLIEIRDILK